MDQVLAAIHALYHGSDATHQAQANQWLMQYQATKDAWGTSLQLLRHPSMTVQYVAAQTLYAKTKGEWMLSVVQTSDGGSPSAALTAEEKSALMAQLMNELRVMADRAEQQGTGDAAAASSQQQQSVTAKLAQTLALMAAKTPNGPAGLLQELSSMFVYTAPSSGALMVEELLKNLAEEVDRLPGSYAKIEDVKAQLRRQSDSVLAMLHKNVAHALQALIQTDQQLAAAPSSSAAHSSYRRALSTHLSNYLSVLLSWGSYGLGLVQLHRAGLLTSICQLFAHTISAPLLSDACDFDLIHRCVEVFEWMLDDKSYPRAVGRDDGVEVIVQVLIQAAKPVYERTVAECVRIMSQAHQQRNAESATYLSRADDLCRSICLLSSVLGETEMDYLACMEGGDEFPQLSPHGTNIRSATGATVTPASPPNPLHQAYFHFHLSLTSHPYSKVLCELSLDVWSALQDTPVAQRKFPELKGPIFEQLLGVLVRQSAYPAGFVAFGQALQLSPTAPSMDPSAESFQSNFLDDADAWFRFRGLMLESFLAIFALLGKKYVQMLAAELRKDAQTRQAGGGVPVDSWQQVESILHALQPVSREVRDLFLDDEVNVNEKQQLHAELVDIMRHVWSLAPPMPDASQSQQPQPQLSTAQPRLLATCCGFIQSFSFLYQYSPSQQASQEMLERSVSFLLASILPTQQCGQADQSDASSTASAPASHTGTMAGRAFRSLCCDNTTTCSLLIRSPALLGEIIRLLFHAPTSTHIAREMKQQWLQGLANLVAAIAYSDDSLAQLRNSQAVNAGNNSMAMATAYLKEITTPTLTAIQTIFSHVQSAQQQAGQQPASPSASPPPPSSYLSHPQIESVRNGLREYWQLLASIFIQLAHPNGVQLLQARAQLFDIVEEMEKQQQQTSNSPPSPTAPQSVALQLYSSLWPYLQQAPPLLLSFKDLTRDEETFDAILSIYSSCLDLLYPSELSNLLPQLLGSVLSIYSDTALPAALAVLDAAINTRNIGANTDLRHVWLSLINQVYKSTMLLTKTDLKSHAELFRTFFQFVSSCYESSTYCLIANPANPLPHILQLAVTLLDSLGDCHAVVQRVLFFLQELLNNHASIDILPEAGELRAMLAQIWLEQGSGVIRQIMVNLTHTMPPMLDRKAAQVLYASNQYRPIETKEWIQKAIMSEYWSANAPNITEQVSVNRQHTYWKSISNTIVYCTVHASANSS